MVLPRWALLTAMVLLSLVFGGCDSSADGEDICCAAHGEAFEASVSQCEFEGGEAAAAEACDAAPGNGDTVCCVWSGWSPTEVSAFNCDSQGGEVVADGVCSGDIVLEGDDDDTAEEDTEDSGGIPDASAGAGAGGPCCVYPDGSVYYVSDEFCVLAGGAVETGPVCNGEGGPVGGDDTGGDDTGGDDTGGDDTGGDDTGGDDTGGDDTGGDDTGGDDTGGDDTGGDDTGGDDTGGDDTGGDDTGGDDTGEDTDPLVQPDGTVCCTWPSGVTVPVPVELCDDQNGSYVEMANCAAAGGGSDG